MLRQGTLRAASGLEEDAADQNSKLSMGNKKDDITVNDQLDDEFVSDDKEVEVEVADASDVAARANAATASPIPVVLRREPALTTITSNTVQPI